jgi:undecaprenyl-diphosphatase
MNWFESLLLGIVQGLTEFLPVSSSGHLEIGKALFGDNSSPEERLMFTVILHFATALSTIVVFRKEIIRIFKGLFQFKYNEELIFSLKIIISMVPAALVGYFFEDLIESFFDGRILFVGWMLIVTAILLVLADTKKKNTHDVSFIKSFIIGIAQAIAILPGISRSGATISTSVLLGIERETAAKFSFLMVLPLIFGKVAKDIIGGTLHFSSEQTLTYGIGFVGAFIAGLIACSWMIAIVKKSRLKYFAIYCLIIGIVTVSLSILF